MKRNYNSKFINTNNSDIEDDIIISSDDEQEYDDRNIAECPTLIQKKSFISSIWKLINPDNLQMKDYINDTNDELISGDEDNNSINFDIQSRELNINQANTMESKCSFKRNLSKEIECFFVGSGWLLLRTALKSLKFIRNIILLMYFLLILFANLPFATLKNITIFLKCYTRSPSILYIPLNIIPTLARHFMQILQNSFLCRSEVNLKKFKSKYFNINNKNHSSEINNFNSSEISDCIHGRIFIYSIMGICLILAVVFCSFYPKSKICKVQRTYQYIKIKINHYSDVFYMLPGESCMKAGRCCRGYLEGIFRWLSCSVTVPIRFILIMWPKRSVDIKLENEGRSGIQLYTEKIYEDINQIKEDINYQEETLLYIQQNLINLEQNVNEKANSVNKLKPKVEILSQIVEKSKNEMDVSMNSLKQIINLKSDIDKMIDSIRTDSLESAVFVKGSLNRMKTSIEADQQRLKTQIENLESFVKDDQTKDGEKNQRILKRIQNEIDSINNVRREIKKRILPLSQILSKFKEMADNLNKDLRNKLNEEMIHHEQMSKRTEKMCLTNSEKLKNELVKAKNNLACFINKTIMEQSNIFYMKLKKDVSDSLYERTVEMAQITMEQALIKQTKSEQKIAKNIKKCSLFSYIFNVKELYPKCLKDEKILINMSSLCKTDNGSFPIEENRIKDKVDNIIDRSLNSILSDNIGKVDFALESSGGSIIIERSTGSYTGRAAFLSLFGFTFGKVIKSIRKVIQPGNLPGECWAFQGNSGDVVIMLARSIAITAVTIDHASRLLTPDGKILSAPKEFHVYALKDSSDYSGKKLGNFEYDQNGDPIQTFYLSEKSPNTKFVQFSFLNNHGNEEYTCIYRIRVHGVYSDQQLINF